MHRTITACSLVIKTPLRRPLELASHSSIGASTQSGGLTTDERRRQFLAVNALCFILLFLAGIQSLRSHPAEIILIRHAEKPPDDANLHLTARGRERAGALAALLTTAPDFVAHGRPVALFAARSTPHGHGQRTRETLEPLATQLNLPIQMPYPAGEYAALAKYVLQEPQFDGKTVVICWVHESLPQLAAACGVKRHPARWKSSAFDRVWLITYHGQKASLADLPQHILPGDSTE
jgi:phosphohistidine phosphatase SixA